MSGTKQFVGLTDKRIDPKSGTEQTFDNTSHETAPERESNTLEEHRVSAPEGGMLGAKNKLGK